jgi:hypothetical protein
VRILKHLRDAMNANGIAAAKPIASYLYECLVWNVPNDGFGHDSLLADVRWVLAHLFNNTRRDEDCKDGVPPNACQIISRVFGYFPRRGRNEFLRC